MKVWGVHSASVGRCSHPTGTGRLHSPAPVCLQAEEVAPRSGGEIRQEGILVLWDGLKTVCPGVGSRILSRRPAYCTSGGFIVESACGRLGG